MKLKINKRKLTNELIKDIIEHDLKTTVDLVNFVYQAYLDLDKFESLDHFLLAKDNQSFTNSKNLYDFMNKIDLLHNDIQKYGDRTILKNYNLI